MKNKKTLYIFLGLGVLVVLGVFALSSVQGGGSNYQGYLSGKVTGPKRPLTNEPTPAALHPKVDVTLSSIVSGGNLPGPNRTKLLAFDIKVSGTGGSISFKSANNSQILVNLNGQFANGSPNTCFLTDGALDYAKTTTGFGTNAFDFKLKDLTIPVGGVKTLYVECDTTSATTKDDTLTTELVFMNWSDWVSKSYKSVNITGPTFTHP